jgi:hypothetical protein
MMDTKSHWEEALFRDVIKKTYFSSAPIYFKPLTFKQKVRNWCWSIINRVSDTFLVLIGKKIAVDEDSLSDY